MSYKINTEEPEKVKSIKLGLRNNVMKFGKPYCPCSLRRDESTVCPCQEFRLHPEMKKCHCGLYVRPSIEWLPVVYDKESYPGYEVSDAGEVRNAKGLILKPTKDHTGHYYVQLFKQGSYKVAFISRCVAEVFIPNPLSLPIVRHLNDKPEENNKENLAWGTGKDNAADKRRNGKQPVGSNHAAAKLTEQQVEAIRASTLTQRELAKLYQVSEVTIWKVLNNISYIREDEE